MQPNLAFRAKMTAKMTTMPAKILENGVSALIFRLNAIACVVDGSTAA